MGELEVDTNGLQAVAARAEVIATELAQSDTPILGSNPWQPSTIAVRAVSVSASHVSQALARRMSATAEDLAEGSVRYAGEDEHSASSIRTIDL